MNNKELILNYVNQTIKTKNEVPTIKEICIEVGIEPIPTIKDYLNKVLK